MPKYVIERDIPSIGGMLSQQLITLSRKSNAVLHDLGPAIQWIESFVTSDKMYCLYIAPNEDMIRQHAAIGGFPLGRISEVKRTIDPTTGESARQIAGATISSGSEGAQL